jgi:hypothetical protein
VQVKAEAIIEKNIRQAFFQSPETAFVLSHRLRNLWDAPVIFTITLAGTGMSSSFFTLPASQRKRKREDRVAAPGSKKRGVAVNGDDKEESTRRRRERDESISGSESEDDEDVEESTVSGDESASESDEGETAAERRLKLAERYLENIREEVDEAGFDAAEIDRDLIAERLKEDVVCFYFLCISCSSVRAVTLTPYPGRGQRSSIPPDWLSIRSRRSFSLVLPCRYPVYYVHCCPSTLCLYRLER